MQNYCLFLCKIKEILKLFLFKRNTLVIAITIAIGTRLYLNILFIFAGAFVGIEKYQENKNKLIKYLNRTHRKYEFRGNYEFILIKENN